MTIITPVFGELGDPGWAEEITDAVNAATDTLAEAGTFTSSWLPWTPTLTNLTLGNGTVTSRYQQVGKSVKWRFKFKLGSTSAVGTGPSFTLPVAPHSSIAALEDLLGSALLLDSGSAQRFGSVRLVSGSTAEFVGYSTTGVVTAISSTSPHTWATNDSLACWGEYEAA